jgi:hypothetical protein
MEKLALLERKRIVQREVRSLREMAESLAVFGKKQDRLQERLGERLRLQRRTNESAVAGSFLELLAAE